MTKTLAELLLRRKELQNKVDQLKPLSADTMLAAVFERVSVNDSIDEITAQVPRVSTAQITAAYDHYASVLRQVDAAIQQANWTTKVEIADNAFEPFNEPESLKETPIPIRKGRMLNR